MSITLVTKDTKFVAGQLVCAASNTKGCITYPFPLTKVVGAKLYYMRDRVEKCILRKSIVFLVDTKEEGEALADLYIGKVNEINLKISEATSTIRRDASYKWDKLIQDRIAGRDQGLDL